MRASVQRGLLPSLPLSRPLLAPHWATHSSSSFKSSAFTTAVDSTSIGLRRVSLRRVSLESVVLDGRDRGASIGCGLTHRGPVRPYHVPVRAHPDLGVPVLESGLAAEADPWDRTEVYVARLAEGLRREAP